jgi:hypothetical protein
VTPASWLSKIGIDIPSLERSLLERKEQNHAHYPPSDEPLSWDTKGKVVTLSAAIMTAHLVTARLIFGGFRSICDQALRIATNRIKDKVDSLIAQKAAASVKAGKNVTGLAFELAQISDDNQAAAAKEAKIRKECLDGMRDLWHTALAQRKSKRSTKRVLTRHESHKQRKANKKWHSRRST